MVAPPTSNLQAIRNKVRRLTASPDPSQLSDNDLDDYINTFYTQDFPYAIKIGQTKKSLSFYTQPNKDRYILDGSIKSSIDVERYVSQGAPFDYIFRALDINNIQGLREPVYVEGYKASFYKSREEFYNVWPKLPVEERPIQGYQTSIANITAPAANGVVTTVGNHGLLTGDSIFIDGVLGTIEVNAQTFTITVLSPNTFQLNFATVNPYISGGIINKFGPYNFTLNSAPFLAGEFTLGVPTTNQSAQIQDDGQGRLIDVLDPFDASGNPVFVGSVDYITGAVSVTFNEFPLGGEDFVIFVAPYLPSRPRALLFFNNELVVRPIPEEVYKIELEVFLSPVAFLQVSDDPILKQWHQYIALGAAEEILQDRQDVQGVEIIAKYKRDQEALVLERQAVAQIGERNVTEFTSTNRNNYDGYYY